MFTVTSTITEARAALNRLLADVPATMDTAVAEGLDTAIEMLIPVTHERTGDMRAGYRSRRAGTGLWDLLNEQDYAKWQFEGAPAHNIPHAFGYMLPFGTSGRFGGKFHPGQDADAELNAVLDNTTAVLDASLEAAVTRLVASIP